MIFFFQSFRFKIERFGFVKKSFGFACFSRQKSLFSLNFCGNDLIRIIANFFIVKRACNLSIAAQEKKT
jgi:hypothetical protein